MPSIGHNPTQHQGRSSSSSSSHHARHSRLAPDFQPLSNSARSAEASVRHKALMALASRPRCGVTLALAGAIAHSWQVRGMWYLPLFGLEAETTCRVLSCHFPGIDRMMGAAWGELQQPEVFTQTQALTDLVEMLDQHRTVVDEDSTWLARAVTTSCLGDDELWRDMNLPSDTPFCTISCMTSSRYWPCAIAVACRGKSFSRMSLPSAPSAPSVASAALPTVR